MRQAMPPALINQELLVQEMTPTVVHRQLADHPILAQVRISLRTEDSKTPVINTRESDTLDVEVVYNRLRTEGTQETIVVQSMPANIKAM